MPVWGCKGKRLKKKKGLGYPPQGENTERGESNRVGEKKRGG